MCIDKKQIRACLFEGCQDILDNKVKVNDEISDFWKNYSELKKGSTDKLIETWNFNKKEILASQKNILKMFKDYPSGVTAGNASINTRQSNSDPKFKESQIHIATTHDHLALSGCKEQSSSRSINKKESLTNLVELNGKKKGSAKVDGQGYGGLLQQQPSSHEKDNFFVEPPCHSLRIAWLSINRMQEGTNLDKSLTISPDDNKNLKGDSNRSVNYNNLCTKVNSYSHCNVDLNSGKLAQESTQQVMHHQSNLIPNNHETENPKTHHSDQKIDRGVDNNLIHHTSNYPDNGIVSHLNNRRIKGSTSQTNFATLNYQPANADGISDMTANLTLIGSFNSEEGKYLNSPKSTTLVHRGLNVNNYPQKPNGIKDVILKAKNVLHDINQTTKIDTQQERDDEELSRPTIAKKLDFQSKEEINLNKKYTSQQQQVVVERDFSERRLDTHENRNYPSNYGGGYIGHTLGEISNNSNYDDYNTFKAQQQLRHHHHEKSKSPQGKSNLEGSVKGHSNNKNPKKTANNQDFWVQSGNRTTTNTSNMKNAQKAALLVSNNKLINNLTGKDRINSSRSSDIDHNNQKIHDNIELSFEEEENFDDITSYSKNHIPEWRAHLNSTGNTNVTTNSTKLLNALKHNSSQNEIIPTKSSMTSGLSKTYHSKTLSTIGSNLAQVKSHLNITNSNMNSTNGAHSHRLEYEEKANKFNRPKLRNQKKNYEGKMRDFTNEMNKTANIENSYKVERNVVQETKTHSKSTKDITAIVNIQPVTVAATNNYYTKNSSLSNLNNKDKSYTDSLRQNSSTIYEEKFNSKRYKHIRDKSGNSDLYDSSYNNGNDNPRFGKEQYSMISKSEVIEGVQEVWGKENLSKIQVERKRRSRNMRGVDFKPKSKI